MRIIDADKLMEELNNSQIEGDKYYAGLGKAKSIICDMPTFIIEPNIIHARWEGVNPMIDTIECSHCGYQEQSLELVTPYCGWCGAIMDNFEMDEEI